MTLAITIEQIQTFLLIFFRVGGIVIFAPVLGSNTIPPMVKIGISMGATILFFPGLAGSIPPIPNDALLITLALAGELLIGVAIGLLAQVISVAARFAGRVVGFHMGFRIANVFDPSAQMTVSIIGAYYNLVTILLLLSMNFHLVILGVVRQSFAVIPPLGMNMRLEAGEVILRVGANIYLFAVQVVGPVLAALFLVEVVIAVLAKTARQFNMLMLQFPIKILLGMMVLTVAIRTMPRGVEYMLGKVLEQIDLLLRLLG